MRRESKVWGQRWLMRIDSTHANSFLKLKKGYQCSWHKHEQKYNLFVVIWGKVGILTEDIIDGSKNEITLTEGQCFTTMPGQRHQFKVYEDSGMIEEMYVEYSEADIQREDLGGEVTRS